MYIVLRVLLLGEKKQQEHQQQKKPNQCSETWYPQFVCLKWGMTSVASSPSLWESVDSLQLFQVAEVFRACFIHGSCTRQSSCQFERKHIALNTLIHWTRFSILCSAGAFRISRSGRWQARKTWEIGETKRRLNLRCNSSSGKIFSS